MQKKVFISLGAIVVLITLGIFAFGYFNKPVEPDNTDIISFSGTIGLNDASNDSAMNGNANFQEPSSTKIVEITSSGFSPNTLEISQGESVKFINKKSGKSWPASAVHPTHTVYPGSDISKCGTEEESMIFDACRDLSEGESYTFTFNEVGTWNYHDHLDSSVTGTIIVN